MNVFPKHRSSQCKFFRARRTWTHLTILIFVLIGLVLMPIAGMASRAEAQVEPAAPAQAATLEAPEGQTITIPGMQTPNGLAVHGNTRHIYVTSRNNGMLYMLDPNTYAVLHQAAVGSLPWGVAVDPTLNRVWVASFGSGAVKVLDGNTLALLTTISMGSGAQPTFVGILPGLQRVFVANHGVNTIAVINSATYNVEKTVRPGDTGAWGLAVNPNLNQVYVTFRESATLVTLDAAYNWEPRPNTTFRPCGGSPASPYGLAFNQNTNKLYLACAPAGSVNTAVIYYASNSGLLELRREAIGAGGDNGGGVAVNPASGYAFFTNSLADTVSIIGHPSNQVVGQEPTGRDPFAVAVDGAGGRVIVGNRGSNNLTVIADPYLPAAQKVNGVAVNPTNGKVFVTSRENGLLLRLKGNGATDVEGWVMVGRLPWGVAVNSTTDRVYVANFADGDIRVVQASTLAPLGSIPVGGKPTFVEVNTATNRVFTVSHAENKLVVINGASNTVETSQATGGDGAFGLALNSGLNRAYVSHRNSRDIITMDGANGWKPIASQRIDACGAGRAPYALAFNSVNNRLYVACATGDNVDSAVVYLAQTTGLTRQAVLPLGRGGADGGGGITVNTATGNVYFTNSEAGTVSVVDGQNRLAGAPIAVGLDPFGVAADAARGYVYVGLRLGNDVVVLRDTSTPVSGAKIYLSRRQGCQGAPVTIYGSGFLPNPSGQVEVRVDGALVATAPVDSSGNFMTNIVFPGPRNPGGPRTVTVYDPALPANSASATLITPRTDLPVIFMGGIAGSQLAATQTFFYEIPPYNRSGNGEVREYKAGEQIWLGEKSISEGLFGKDTHFYPLRLTENGQDPMPDKRGRVGYIAPTEPIWELQPPLWQPKVDIYRSLYNRMRVELGNQGRAVYNFGYDWRKDLNLSDPLLEQKINQVLSETGKDKVVIVAHSMGGVLTRNYILKHGAAKIDQLITFGTPYLGSVHPAKYLEMGDNMGMSAPFGNELSPLVVKEMAKNFGGLYELLPSPLWFSGSPFDANYNPKYLGLAGWMLKNGILSPTYQAMDISLLDYGQTKAYLARNYNAQLVELGNSFNSTGIGDLTKMTDQYINQRIIGLGKPTWGHLWTCEEPCVVCTKNLFGNGLTCKWETDVPAIPVLDTVGDDTVPLRSAAGYEPLSKMLNDGQYYFVDNAAHMTLGADARVQNLVLGLLKGEICTNQMALPLDAPRAAGETPYGLAPDAAESDYIGLGATTGVQLTLLGDAEMIITDPEGRTLAEGNGLLTGYANAIPGASLIRVEGAQVAALTSGGPFSVAIRGVAESSAVRLTVSNLEAGAIQRTVAFPGVPVTTTTAATLTLSAPAIEDNAQLTYRYTPESPEETFTGAALDGPQAGDVTPPTVHVAIEVGSGLVTVTADDAGGSGVMQVLYSGETEATHFTPYEGPFAWPADSACVTGLALDHAGNAGVDALCQTWLPLVVK